MYIDYYIFVHLSLHPYVYPSVCPNIHLKICKLYGQKVNKLAQGGVWYNFVVGTSYGAAFLTPSTVI